MRRRCRTDQIAASLVADDLSDPLVALENAMPSQAGQLVPTTPLPYAPSPLSTALYFCVPPNDQLLGLWDTIDDRLTKIRNCQNIDGVVEQLPLLAPPIPPGLLVQAAAAGLDLSQVMGALTQPSPIYRYAILYRQAIEFCHEVRTLGNALLSALEKDDANALALLRATQEVSLLQQMRLAFATRVQEAQTEQQDLVLYRQRVQDRHDWYAAQPFMYSGEITAAALNAAAAVAKVVAAALHTGSAIAYVFPDIDAGVAGFGASATLKLKFGGQNVGHGTGASARVANSIAAALEGGARMASDVARSQARQAAWQREVTLSQDELNEIDRAKTPIAQMKVDIANFQLADHDLKTQQAQAVAQFLQTKFTNTQLYDWMIGQISAVYLQAYNLAWQMAKRTEACYRLELGLPTASFIQPGYWDNLHQGLLAADGLIQDLQRMQAAHVDNNFREYEISRQISLATLDPLAFETLKETGNCFITVPESLFDQDYPGHYMRRIKWAGVIVKFTTSTRPPVVNCTLSLLHSSIRMTSDATPPYPDQSTPSSQDTRFTYPQMTPSIATTNGGTLSGTTYTPDYGLFETTLHYIITDDRYLPFELAGAISSWQIELSQAANTFDFQTVSDVVVQINYTARNGGSQLAIAANSRAAGTAAAAGGAVPVLDRLRFAMGPVHHSHRRGTDADLGAHPRNLPVHAEGRDDHHHSGDAVPEAEGFHAVPERPAAGAGPCRYVAGGSRRHVDADHPAQRQCTIGGRHSAGRRPGRCRNDAAEFPRTDRDCADGNRDRQMGPYVAGIGRAGAARCPAVHCLAQRRHAIHLAEPRSGGGHRRAADLHRHAAVASPRL